MNEADSFKVPFGKIIGLLVILIAVAILGFTVLEQKLTNFSIPKPTSTPTITATPTPIPTPKIVNTPADYKIYQGEEFTISYPSEWVLAGTVFSIPNEEELDDTKVAEFAPGFITPVELISCDEIIERTVNGGEEIQLEQGYSYSFDFPIGEENEINRSVVPVTGRAWHLFSYETIPDGVRIPTPWYPHLYCTQEESNLFLITFYERDLENIPTLPHEEILSSFEFSKD